MRKDVNLPMPSEILETTEKNKNIFMSSEKYSECEKLRCIYGHDGYNLTTFIK